VRFYRARLEQLKNDYESDMQTVSSQLDLARGRVQVGELSVPQFDELEGALVRAKTDMAKAVDLLVRAMNANTVRDVPHGRGTFLARLARPVGQQGIETDSWITWGGALALIACIVLPTIGSRSALAAFQQWHVNFPSVHWFMTVPVLGAVLVSLAGLIPIRPLRGLTVLALGMVICLASAFALHELTYTTSEIGRTLRDGGLVRPGIVMFFLACAAIILSAGAALANVKRGWLAILVGVCGTAVALCAIFTDLGGYYLPAPEISISVKDPTITEPDGVADVTLTNLGHRAMRVANDPTDAGVQVWDRPFLYYFALERRIGQESWRPQRAQEIRSSVSNEGMIRPGQSLGRQYALAPGSYRVVLMASLPEHTVVSSPFTIDTPPAPAVVPSVSPESVALPPSTIPGAPAPVDATGATPTTPAGVVGPSGTPGAPQYVGLSMELKGLVTTPGREPQFSMLVRLPDGSTRERRVSIGSPIQDKWIVSEFNPQLSTITITNGQMIYILRRGERIDIAPDK